MQREQLKRRGRYSGLLWPALVILLSACETAQMGTTQLELAAIEPTQLMFSDDASIGPWEDAASVINDEGKLRGRLKPYSSNPNGPDIPVGLLIQDVKNKNANAGGGQPGTDPFKGLGGGYYHTMLKAAWGKVNQSTQEFDGARKSEIKLSGRITDYSFSRTGNPNNNTGEGTLIVDTYQTVKIGSLDIEENYVWTITINPNGYKIQKIEPLVDDPNVPNEEELEAWDPFPGTIKFPKEVKERILLKGYNVKLHASGPGAIKIEKVLRNGVEINNSDADFRPLLHADQDSCVDIFLKVGLDSTGNPDFDEIPKTYQDLIDNFLYSYCLGRCAHPAIINSR